MKELIEIKNLRQKIKTELVFGFSDLLLINNKENLTTDSLNKMYNRKLNQLVNKIVKCIDAIQIKAGE